MDSLNVITTRRLTLNCEIVETTANTIQNFCIINRKKVCKSGKEKETKLVVS